MKWILASASPRRRELLSKLDMEFDVILPRVNEMDHFPGENIPEYTRNLARLKAISISRIYPKSAVIGADTIVVLDGDVLEKPTDKIEAVDMLQRLSGQTHQVMTGVSIQLVRDGIDLTFHEITRVTFHQLTISDIHYYIDHYPPYDKAGAYGIQDWSAIFVHHIEGCYHNVVGFPLPRFYREIADIGLTLKSSTEELTSTA